MKNNIASAARAAFAIATAGCCLSLLAGNAANPVTNEIYPVPVPVSYSLDMDAPVPFDATTKVMVDCPDPAAARWIDEHFAAWYGKLAPRAVSGPAALDLRPGDEAYAFSAGQDGVKLKARTLAGARWGVYTMRQLAIAKRGTFKLEGRLLPTCKVSDSPHLDFRGIHICWFPELRTAQVERMVRLAAFLKFNYLVLEPWGMYRSEKHPWWGWPDGKMTKAEVRRLTAIGRDLGVTLIPQINAFGHATSARGCTRKHAILDLHPEYEPLFEPGGWNWCISNPETLRVLRELIDEMLEDFGHPPYFHLGCDEAEAPGCPECRKTSYGELVCRHIGDLAKYVESRGARAMIWHDMLLKRGDPRWKGFTAMGTDTTATMADTLSKNVIICDWEYSYGNMKEVRKDWPTTVYFKEKGFPVLGCPWMNYNAMRPMADTLARIGGFGYLQTTWHHLRGDDWRRMCVSGASAAWGAGEPNRTGGDPFEYRAFGALLRIVGQDMKVTDPLDTGILNYQVPPAWWVDNN